MLLFWAAKLRYEADAPSVPDVFPMVFRLLHVRHRLPGDVEMLVLKWGLNLVL